ncbi:unnamed protein product, partial [Rotaria sp. Silwood1]
MALEQKTPINVNVKLEQFDVFMNNILPTMQIEKVNNGDKLHFLSTMIDDPLVTDEKKAKYLSQCIPINYENKEWQ